MIQRLIRSSAVAVFLTSFSGIGFASPVLDGYFESVDNFDVVEFPETADLGSFADVVDASALAASSSPGILSSVGAPQRTVYGSFDIAVSYQNPAELTPAVIAAFEASEAFWESRILGYESQDLADFITNNHPSVEILADLIVIDGVGGILGQAGSTLQVANAGGAAPPDPNNVIVSVAGVMNFDSADVGNMELNGSLGAVIIHEMGHVLGFSCLFWDYVAATDGSCTDTSYTGVIGLAAYQQEFDPLATFIPVENDGGPGTAFSHWDEDLFANHLVNFGNSNNPELMTGYLDFPTTVSNTTLASFEDLGYVVSYLTSTVPVTVSVPMTFWLLLSGVTMMQLRSRRRQVNA